MGKGKDHASDKRGNKVHKIRYYNSLNIMVPNDTASYPYYKTDALPGRLSDRNQS